MLRITLIAAGLLTLFSPIPAIFELPAMDGVELIPTGDPFADVVALEGDAA